MLKTIYIVVTHTYWEHFGSQPSKFEFDTQTAAKAFANKYESDYFMEDGYYADMYKTTKVVITPEEEAKRLVRQQLRKTFDWKKDSLDYGIYTFWDGSKDIYFITLEDGEYYIYFLKGKEKYRYKSFPFDDGESMRTFKMVWF